MLHILTGTIGSGKTTKIHTMIKQAADEGKSSLYLIVPQQFTHESDVGLLHTAGVRAATQTEVLSFERLAEKIFNSHRRPSKPLLGDCARAVFASLTLNEVADRLKIYSHHTDKTALIAGLLDIIGELKQCKITADELRGVAHTAESGVLKEKAKEIALIYETYEALVSQSFFDSSDRLEMLCDILDESQCMKGATVFLDGFRRFTAQEYKVLERILTQAQDVYAAFCCDGIFIAEDEANAFTSIKQTVNRLCKAANKHGVPVASPMKITDTDMGFSTYTAGELQYLEQNLFCDTVDEYENNAEAITVCAAKNPADECDYTARTIKRLMREKDIRCRDICVIYRSSGEYDRELAFAMKKYGVPVFEDERQPVTNQPLICLVRNIISVCADGFSTDSLMHAVKTGLLPLCIEEWSMLENYVFMWDIKGSSWLEQWHFNPDGLGEKMTEAREERLSVINEIRQKLIAPIVSLKEKCLDATGMDICRHIFDFLTENGCNKALGEKAKSFDEKGETIIAMQQQQIWDILADTLNQLAISLGDRKISMKRFASVFEVAISIQTLGQIPAGFDTVKIGTATRLQSRMSKVVFVLGMNEGMFPLPPTGGGLFTDAQRLELERLALEMARNSRTHALDEKFVVYNAVCSARQRLYISYSLADSSSKLISKSETVRKIQELFPKANIITSVANPLDLIESDESAFELMSRLWNEKSDLSASLKEYFSKRVDYAGKMEALHRAGSKKPFSMDRQQALRLFSERISISPSRAEVYEKCPFEYFCQYGLDARARKKALFNPAQSGSIIHTLLEKMLKQFSANDIAKTDEETLKEEIHSLTIEYADEFLGGYAALPSRMLYLLLRIEKTVEVIIKRLGEEFCDNMFTPCDFELKIGGNSDIRSFRVELDKERSIEIYGTIDRVDLMTKDGKKYIRVIDYKSGKKEFYLSDVLNGLNMQMLMYLIALWANGKKHYGGEIVPCGVFYLPARFLPYDAERRDSMDDMLAAVMENGKMNGLVLDNTTALEAMSAGGFSFLPISRKKDGSLSGNFIDIITMTKLKNKITDILSDMADKLQNGCIPAKPVLGKNYDNVCEYCDYNSICCHESDGEYRYIGFSKHEECLDLLNEEDEYGSQLD